MLLPYHRFALRSRLSPQEAFRAMFAQTSRSEARWFRGEVDEDGFKVRRVVDHRSSIFVPLVIGRTQSDPQGSRIVVSVRLPIVTMLFMTMWLAIPGSAALAEAPRLGAAAWLTALFYALLVLIPFWYEAIQQERMLRRIFGERHAATPSPT